MSPAVAAPAREPAPTFEPAPAPQGEAFSKWLLDQKNRRDWIADLAKAALADRGFPKNADPDEVRARLQALGADEDAFEQVDDAERAWMMEEAA